MSTIVGVLSLHNHQMRVHEIAVGASSYRVVDVIATAAVDLSECTALPPDVPLRTPTIVGSTINVSISITTGTTTDEIGSILGPLILRLHFPAPSAPRYVLIPFSLYYNHALGTVYCILVEGWVYRPSLIFVAMV